MGTTEEDAFNNDSYDNRPIGLKAISPSPLVTLPHELITEVFLFTFDTGVPEKYVNSFDPGQPKYTQEFGRAKRIWNALHNYMLTCRYWRETALQAPILWRDVHVGVGIMRKFTDAMLRRSREAPIHLHASFKKHTVIDVDMLRPHLRRVAQLHLRLAGAPPKLIEIEEDMPALQHLVVNGGSMTLPLLSKTSPLPNLTLIRAAGVTLRLILPFLRPTVTRLYIRCLESQIRILMHALKGLPVLECLAIDSLFVTKLSAPHDQELPHVDLPKLSACHISAIGSEVIPIIERITFPDRVITSRQFSLKMSACERAEVSRAVGLILERLSNVNDDVMAEVLSSGSFNIQMNWDGPGHDFPRDRQLVLDIPTPSENDRPFLICATRSEIGMGDILDWLTEHASARFKSHIQHMDITSHDYDDIPYASLSSKLTDLTGLRTLRLDRVAGVWSHSALTHQSSLDIVIPIPTLQRLVLVDTKFRHRSPDDPTYEPDEYEPIWALRDMLELQKACGNPLQSLSILNGVHFGKEDVRMLREYVTNEVEWDERVV
ncbi:hypothetical protein BXZ70DRAFT_86155 [Cristinia sonorae]|uniref:F-box domain-containing protein n=1 Tax=Cristinia sonorae TaxID=1940300 RepID=A0A8K0UQR6_9AGAR|nr:hypothetical protein BXZ70DRAFT_86155 [Cristinia sonorae]